MKSLEDMKNVLLVQSNIENVLLKLMKEKIPTTEQKRIGNKVTELNSKLYDYEELIEYMTKPMKLYDITISILRQKVLKEERVSKEIESEVKNCYCSIMSFYANEAKQYYPKLCYDKILSLAKLYYMQDIEINNQKMPIKKCNDAFKNCFFPTDQILLYAENFNNVFFGRKIEDISYLEDLFDSHKVKTSPYWFVALLQIINEDCLSYVIKILDEHYRKAIVAMRKYTEIIESIDPLTMDPAKRNILAEFKQYNMTFKQIITRIKQTLDTPDGNAQINPYLAEKLVEMLKECEQRKSYSDKKIKPPVSQDGSDSNSSHKVPLSPPKHGFQQDSEFSFKEESSSSQNQQLEDTKHGKTEEKKEQDSSSESDSSENVFVRNNPPKRFHK